ncbi:unnamed protein product [Blepharisma stoltei]|uniref:Receptor ligand binding region domain-containing protein n=1 Tax=Blepharisma stoltei TaxID=1481888 RepID=A0AAU9JHZ6_9CILI|nr:unnamed protein product [Blepharisma stoltei]
MRKAVGSIQNGNVTIFGDLIFPGQSSIIPKSTKKILQLSISAGTTNPGASASPIAVVGARGSFAVQDLINEGNDILPHFYLKIISFDCGVTVFNASFTESCFSKSIDQLGLSHISAFSSTITIGSIQIFKNLNITVPVIGATNADDSLSSIVNFPTYSRVQMAYSFICPKFSIIIKGLGWNSAAVLYQNDAWGLAAYSYIKKNSEVLGLRLVNPEKLRTIPAGLSKSGLKNYTNALQEVIDSQARLLLLIIQYPLGNYILEQLYDLGARKGDFVICAGYQDLPTLISINDTNLYKRLEIGIPMFTLVSEYWAGNVGQEALKRIRSAYYSEPSAFSCFYVDAAYLIASALDYMINRGHDYTNPEKLMATIRTTQFYGCTGRVSIEKGSNDRIVDRMIIEGVKLTSDGSTSIYTIGNFRPFSSQVISIINPIIYADGSTQKPSEYRNTNNRCPFPDKKMKTFKKGRGLLFGICFTSALIMIVITFYIWKKWWNISVEPLHQKEEISIQDAIVAASIGIEFFQYASMGPDFKLISPLLSELSGLFSLNLEDVIKLENGVFWIVVDVVYGGIGLWILLCLVILLQLDEKFPYISLFRFLKWLSDFLMPILGNLCFIPFISICLDIFQCDISIGDNFTDSILAKDCYYFCWKDEHLIYAIISFFALLFYEPLAIFCRPLWQELQPTLHVKTVPLFLMVKTVVQTSLIVLNGTVKRSFDITHGLIFIVFMAFYAVFIFKFKPYNYSRFSWWQGLSVIGIIWLALLSLPGLITNNQNLSISLFAVLLLGWGIIILVGLYIQTKKLPSMLFRKKGYDPSTLFKFAFTFGKSSKISLEKLQQTIKV